MALSDKISLAMVAGEVSGDLLGARLLSGLRTQVPNAEIYGVGGSAMAQCGFESRFPMARLTVRGLFEVIPRYSELKRIQQALYGEIVTKRPSVFVGIDYPGFNLRLEERLKQVGIPTLHFISPQIWAWRGGRIKQIQRSVSHMLVIFPFEELLYRSAGVPVTYVGHPLAQVIPLEPDVAAARRQLDVGENERVVALLPGSRMSEIKNHAVLFVQTARLLLQRDSKLKFVVPLVNDELEAYFVQLIAKAQLQDVPLSLVKNQSYTVLAAADAVLTASGTASLEAALFKKPMVIVYKMLVATWGVMKCMVHYQPWVGLPNILANEGLVPEFIQWDATPAALADAMWQQLEDVLGQQYLKQRFLEIHHYLLRDTAKESAEVVLSLVK